MRVKAYRHSRKVVLREGHFIRFVKRGEWEYCERNNCSGIVIIVALTPEKKVLLIEQYRPPVNKNVIEFPAGLVSDHNQFKGETMMSAAKRELLEETGYQASRITKILEGPVSSGSSGDIVTMVMAKNIKKVGAGGGDHTETIHVHEVPLQRVDVWLKKMERKGCLVEPKIYAGLYFLNKYKGSF